MPTEGAALAVLLYFFLMVLGVVFLFGRVASADLRADKLLKQVLSGEERRQFKERGYLTVPSTLVTAFSYRIPADGGRPFVYEGERCLASLCVVTEGSLLPCGDRVLCFMLHLQANEAAFLRTARTAVVHDANRWSTLLREANKKNSPSSIWFSASRVRIR